MANTSRGETTCRNQNASLSPSTPSDSKQNNRSCSHKGVLFPPKLRGLGLQLWSKHREQSSHKLNCSSTRMGEWVLWKKTRIIMLARLSHVAFSDPLQKQYRYVSVNKQASEEQWLETVLHFSNTESHSLFRLSKKCVILLHLECWKIWLLA